MDPRIQTMQQALQRLPKNDLGLPAGLYRADLLPLPPASHHLTNGSDMGEISDVDTGVPQPHNGHTSLNLDTDKSESSELTPQALNHWANSDPEGYADFEDQLDLAFVPLDYSEHVPQLPSGMPIWDRLSWEPEDSFKAFQLYLAEGKTGKLRQTKNILAQLQYQAESNDISLDTPLEQITLDLIQEWATLYLWATRAQAYDTFREVARRRHRVFMAKETEDRHRGIAKIALQKATDYINSEEFHELMTPKVAVDLLKLASTIERISIGLPANGPSGSGANGDRSSAPESLEVILRSLTGHQKSEQDVQSQNGQLLPDNQLQSLLMDNDTETGIMAQELIIRLTGGVPKSQDHHLRDGGDDYGTS